MIRKAGLIAVCVVLLSATGASAQSEGLPSLQISLGDGSDPQGLSSALKILLLLTVLSLAPSLLVMVTSFTRTVVVLGFLRQAMGTHTMPSNQVVIGLSLFITVFIMLPVFRQANQAGIKPYIEGRMDYQTAMDETVKPFRTFMLSQTREKDLALFISLGRGPKPQNVDDISLFSLIPAFMISELKTAFIIGFLIYLPFLLVDLVVASVLMSMGMMMLPPIMISLPFKLLIFVLADGWYLVVGSLIRSFAP